MHLNATYPAKSMTMGLWIESPHLTQGGGASQSLEAGARYFGGSDATLALLNFVVSQFQSFSSQCLDVSRDNHRLQELREQVKKLNEQLEEISKNRQNYDTVNVKKRAHGRFSLHIYEGKFATFCNMASVDFLIGGTWTFAVEAGNAVNQSVL